MNFLPPYGWFFDTPKSRRKPRKANPVLTPEQAYERQLAALRRCCWTRDIVLTADHTSAVCRTCGTIMPAGWVD